MFVLRCLVLLVVGCLVVAGCGSKASNSIIRQDYVEYMQTIWHLRGKVIDEIEGSDEELRSYVENNKGKIESYQPTESDLVEAKQYIDKLGTHALALIDVMELGASQFFEPSSEYNNTLREFNETVQEICGTLHVPSGE